MDPAIACIQEEQEGPSKQMWLSIRDTAKEMELEHQLANNSMTHNENALVNGQQRHGKLNQQSQQMLNDRSYYNPSRRKHQLTDGRPNTFNMNRIQTRVLGKHNGCPWRPAGFKYSPGVVG